MGESRGRLGLAATIGALVLLFAVIAYVRGVRIRLETGGNGYSSRGGSPSPPPEHSHSPSQAVAVAPTSAPPEDTPETSPPPRDRAGLGLPLRLANWDGTRNPELATDGDLRTALTCAVEGVTLIYGFADGGSHHVREMAVYENANRPFAEVVISRATSGSGGAFEEMTTTPLESLNGPQSFFLPSRPGARDELGFSARRVKIVLRREVPRKISNGGLYTDTPDGPVPVELYRRSPAELFEIAFR